MGLYFVGVINRRRRFPAQRGTYAAGAMQGLLTCITALQQGLFLKSSHPSKSVSYELTPQTDEGNQKLVLQPYRWTIHK
jgi:hypothetical protein